MTDLRKDYFDEKEAAAYMCVSSSKFRQMVNEYTISVGHFGKKKIYRKTDLQRVIEQEAFNGKYLSAQ